MNVALQKKSNAELLVELERLPENMTGEVIDGTLYVMGRPSGAHQSVEMELASDLRRGGGGGPPPSGWLFLTEVSVLFPTQEQVVPDVVGWRRPNIAGHDNDNPYTVRPDWVCEILSDSTRRKDLGPKRELYARQGVPFLWIVEPQARVLEAFALEGGRWVLQGTWTDTQTVKGLAPFDESAFDLRRWWLPE